MPHLRFYKLKFSAVTSAKRLAIWAGLFLFVAAPLAHAEVIGDPNRGKTKAQICAACHGANGISVNDNWPNLAGQKENYIVEQLKAFQDGTRANPIMSGIAKMLTQQDIHDLAAYFSHMKP